MPIKKISRSHHSGRRRGGSFKEIVLEFERTTPFLMFRPTGLTLRAALSKERLYFLMARPPLLLCQGEEFLVF